NRRDMIVKVLAVVGAAGMVLERLVAEWCASSVHDHDDEAERSQRGGIRGMRAAGRRESDIAVSRLWAGVDVIEERVSAAGVGVTRLVEETGDVGYASGGLRTEPL